jgi:outer membrane protein assembly factor BamA
VKVLVFLLLLAGVAHAEGTLVAQTISRAGCARLGPTTAAAPAPTSVENIAAIPVTWSDYAIEGDLGDPPDVVRALFAPVMSRRTSLTDEARSDIIETAKKYGYHVVGITMHETTGTTQAVVHVARLPIVRKVKFDLHQGFFDAPLDDEVARRLRVHAGVYLPWAPQDRACDLYDEEDHVKEYLRDEGFFDADPHISQELHDGAIILHVDVHLGVRYKTGRITIVDPQALAVPAAAIVKQFSHPGTCIVGERFCFRRARAFGRAQLADDIEHVQKLFQQRGYPAVRVRSDFDPATSFDRRTHTVPFTLNIDQRRKLDVRFEGQEEGSVSTESLQKQLTFAAAAATDDVEATNSAHALAQYLQTRGYFDARVTWSRERFSDAANPALSFDRITFHIDQGKSRQVLSLGFKGNKELSSSQLNDVIGTSATKFSTTLLGANTAASSNQLAADVDRIVDAYRRIGYRDAKVAVEAAPDPAALGDAALTAALVAANRGSGLHIRYAIDEGAPTYLERVEITLGEHGTNVTTPEEHALCVLVLSDLAELFHDRRVSVRGDNQHCVATMHKLKFREDDAALTKDQLKSRLYSHGRPRAEVAYEVVPIGPHAVAAHYALSRVQPLRVGKVVIRGNFRTRDGIIRERLGLKEGQLLTQDALADGARQLRGTSLFDSVNIELPDLESTATGEVNAVVSVTERYDLRGTMDVEVGYSSYSGAFVKVIPEFKNLFGLGISLTLTGALGLDLAEYLEHGDQKLKQLTAEATLRFQYWLVRKYVKIPMDAEVTAFDIEQDTPRFGLVTTQGATVAVSRTWNTPRQGRTPARLFSLGFHYDFRVRSRNVDVLRPLGADDDQSQVPISTRIGSFGASLEIDQRTDRAGSLSPLAAEKGYRLKGEVSWAAPYFGGQDTFLKVSATGSKYWSLGKAFVLRADLRYDQGFPFGGEVLLPEVERFFAGGDSTVRGYNDDRLKTEVVRVAVPPLGSGSEQIRILPAGGDIRVMGSLDAQLRVYKFFATALFVDAGMISNDWRAITSDDIRPSVGVALFRIVTPFGMLSWERAIPLHPELGDDPRGRWHISFAARAQF